MAIAAQIVTVGNTDPVFDMPNIHFTDTVIPAVGVITTAIHERDYSRLPIKAHEYIYEANKICHRHHWGLEFLPNDKYSIVGAQIEAGEIIPPPRRSVKSKGTTTIIGRVIKTGGIDPKVHIQRLNSKESFHIAVTEDQAKELAGRLYDVVVLNCDVSWSTDDWEIDRASLKVTSVGEYAKPRSPGRAFARLRELSGSNWDNFDVSNMINDEDGEGVLN